MPLYRYIALDKSGKKVSATLDANSKQHLKDLLRSKDLLLASCELSQKSSSGSLLSNLFEGGVSPKEVFLFSRQLSVLLNAKLPLLKSIELVSDQFSGAFNRILIDIKDDIKGGLSFGAALDKHPKVFPNFYTQLIYAGELSGNLDLVLERLTLYLERSLQSTEKIVGAMAFPIFLLCLVFAVMIGTLVYVVPSLQDMFSQLGGQLPGPTQMLIDLSDIFINNWLMLFTGLSTFIVAFLIWKRTQQGSLLIDSMVLRLPIISGYSKTKAVVQFSKTLGILLESSAGLPESLTIVSNIIDNKVLVNALHTARENIIKEGKIAKYLADTKIFPPIAIYMIQTAEESGHLAEMLTIVGKDYEKELDAMIDTAISMITPALMMFLGFIVLWLMLAIMLPSMSLGSMINQV